MFYESNMSQSVCPCVTYVGAVFCFHIPWCVVEVFLFSLKTSITTRTPTLTLISCGELWSGTPGLYLVPLFLFHCPIPPRFYTQRQPYHVHQHLVSSLGVNCGLVHQFCSINMLPTSCLYATEVTCRALTLGVFSTETVK